jgi:gluconolactonase
LASILAANAELELVANGFTKMAEGPLWWPEQQCLVISDIVGDCSWRVFPDGRHEPFRQPSEHANGRTWDRDGTMLTAEHVSRSITRLVEGQYRTVVTHYQGKRFNSPNDVIVGPNGHLYITDPPFGLAPPYGSRTQQAELDFSGVFQIDVPTGEVRLVHRDFKYPNGITLSPDASRLYVNDSATQAIWVWDTTPAGPVNGRLFADASGGEGVVDGLKCDREGRVYCTAPGKTVAVFDPNGALIGRIEVPEQPSAVAWGDSDFATLYITAETGVYRIKTTTRGVGSGVRG